MTRKDELNQYLQELQLTWPRQHYEALSEQALKEHWTPTDYGSSDKFPSGAMKVVELEKEKTFIAIAVSGAG